MYFYICRMFGHWLESKYKQKSGISVMMNEDDQSGKDQGLLNIPKRDYCKVDECL